MSRDYRLYLDDIRASAEKILQYTRGLDFDTFAHDEKTVDAVVFNFEIIGEAAKHIPDSMRARYPQVDWRRMAGLRDIIAHGYFGLNRRILWDAAQTQIPMLLEQITQILKLEE
ncbi:MAG: DUF86 domain-containing protein [Anaerolineae bacterium]|nr:DUF86 domain-containing protein [Anaerolineae bacterium]